VTRDESTPSPARQFWEVVKASALRRLGKPLLLMYLALLVFGVPIVLGSVALMRFAP